MRENTCVRLLYFLSGFVGNCLEDLGPSVRATPVKKSPSKNASRL